MAGRGPLHDVSCTHPSVDDHTGCGGLARFETEPGSACRENNVVGTQFSNGPLRLQMPQQNNWDLWPSACTL